MTQSCACSICSGLNAQPTTRQRSRAYRDRRPWLEPYASSSALVFPARKSRNTDEGTAIQTVPSAFDDMVNVPPNRLNPSLEPSSCVARLKINQACSNRRQFQRTVRRGERRRGVVDDRRSSEDLLYGGRPRPSSAAAVSNAPNLFAATRRTGITLWPRIALRSHLIPLDQRLVLLAIRHRICTHLRVQGGVGRGTCGAGRVHALR